MNTKDNMILGSLVRFRIVFKVIFLQIPNPQFFITQGQLVICFLKSVLIKTWKFQSKGRKFSSVVDTFYGMRRTFNDRGGDDYGNAPPHCLIATTVRVPRTVRLRLPVTPAGRIRSQIVTGKLICSTSTAITFMGLFTIPALSFDHLPKVL